MKGLFVELTVIGKNKKVERYGVNVKNINYYRKYEGDKGELQTIIFFNGDKKYLVVDEQYSAVQAKIEKITLSEQ